MMCQNHLRAYLDRFSRPERDSHGGAFVAQEQVGRRSRSCQSSCMFRLPQRARRGKETRPRPKLSSMPGWNAPQVREESRFAIRGNPQNRICKQTGPQCPKTGKFDYLGPPNHPPVQWLSNSSHRTFSRTPTWAGCKIFGTVRLVRSAPERQGALIKS